MTAYLLHTGEDPISVAEIKREIGLDGNEHDGLIAVGIATACTLHAARPEEWRIECDEGFERAVARLGRVLKMGKEEVRNGKPCRLVSFAPKPERILAAKTFAAHWARQQRDILETIEAQQRAEQAAYAVAAE